MSRISQLPWFDYRTTQEACASYWTSILRTSYGTESLRHIQGAAINSAYWVGQQNHGICGFMRVGCGKTLTSGLIPVVQNSTRALVVVPGSLLDDTKKAYDKLRLHWKIPLNIRIESYQKIGHKNHQDLLSNYQPDCIVCDEAHFLANVENATVAKRFGVYKVFHPAGKVCRFNWMTGSGFGKSLQEISHLIWWALGTESPIPEEPDLRKMWADCLDNGVEESGRRVRGDLSILTPHLGKVAERSVEDAQSAFGARLFFTPGVIISTDSYVNSGLEIFPIHLKQDAITEQHFDTLRNLWEMPDGWILEEVGKAGGSSAAFGVYRAARQMKLGFCYVHDPRPPIEWLEARREHFSNVRYISQNFPELDSCYIVTQAIIAGKIPWAYDAYVRWKAIEPTHEVNTVARWFSRTALDTCIKWGRSKAHARKPSVIWTAHEVFAKAISKETGWSFFQAGGLDDKGRRVVDCTDMNIIVSTQANQEGRNLQFYADALLTSMNSGPKKNEQQLGRHHREGQKADVVCYDYLVGCREDAEAFHKAYELAHAVKRESFGQEQKLCQATIRFPDPSKMKGPCYDVNKSASERKKVA